MKEECLNCINFRKAVIVGCGFVGSASAFSLMESGLFSQIALIDQNKEKSEGEALDISHGVSFYKPMKIYSGSYDDIIDASIVIITAGANQVQNESRLELAQKNISIFKSIINEIKIRDFKGIILVVSNPVDILTAVTLKLSGLPENKVIGSGTVLDTARLKYEIGNYLNVDLRSIHAFIIGEHGDSEFAVFSSANVSGIKLADFFEIRGFNNYKEISEEITNRVKNSAYEIISKKKATYYGIASTVRRICEAVVRNEKAILPISAMLHGEYGIEGIALSLPAVIGKDGFEARIPIKLNDEETKKLINSAKILSDIMSDYGI